MSVSNGQIANASTFNSAFLSKTTDDVKAAKLGLNDTIDPFSGGSIDNVQGLLNELIFTIGNAGENDSNRNAYSSNVIISDGDSRKTAIEKLDAAFTGLTGSNGYYAEYQSTTFSGAAGVDDTVTSSFSGKVSGGGASAVGVVTSAPNNRCEIRNSSTLKAIDDGAGNLVYGRITESSGTWTLSYYSNVAGVETAYSFSSTNIKIYFPEVFTSLTRPTIPQLTGELSSVSGSGTAFTPKKPVFQSLLTGSGTFDIPYAFVVTSASATAGATYTNNSVTFTVFETISGATLLYATGNGDPLASGTLTKASGTGDATITFSSFSKPLYLKIRMAGGGGGGSGGGNGGAGGGTGSNGSSTTFGSSFLTCTGGLGAGVATGGGGGTGTIASGAYGFATDGTAGEGGNSIGGAAASDIIGGTGGVNLLGGEGACTSPILAGEDAVPNTGAGGGGGACGGVVPVSGGGGGAGGYIDAVVYSPASTYSYAIGSGGSGGSANTGGQVGGDGGSGVIHITAFYQ